MAEALKQALLTGQATVAQIATLRNAPYADLLATLLDAVEAVEVRRALLAGYPLCGLWGGRGYGQWGGSDNCPA